MKPVNINRHLACEMYAGDKCPLFSGQMAQGEHHTINTGDNYMLVFVGGASTYTFDEDPPISLSQPYFLFLGLDQRISITIDEDKVRLTTLYFDKPSKLCSSYTFNNLRPFAPSELKLVPLPIYDPLQRTLETAITLYDDRLWCQRIIGMKLEEIFFIISAYYKPEEVGQLFAPLLRREIGFKEFVYQNFLRCDTVQDLADLRGQNVRKFKKEFAEVFGMPPYTWMLMEKAKYIDERLSDPTVPFSEIIADFRFSSSSHFTVFCRRQFNMTPTQRRRMLIRDEAEKRAAERRAKYAHIRGKVD